MNGILVYDDAGAERNRWLIGRLIEEGVRRGLRLRSVSAKDALSERDVGFAVVRTIAPELSERLEARGVWVFNNAQTSRVANDKWETYRLARSLSLPVLPTRLWAGERGVVKSVDGHGGSEVFLVQGEGDARAVKEKLASRRAVVQPLCSEPGLDMRVYVLGGRAIAAMVRRSEHDFRSNFSLGGRAERSEADAEQLAAVKAIVEALRCDFVGIDFIRHEGKWILNEVEDVVGTRMLYAHTGIDAAALYMEYIAERLKI